MRHALLAINSTERPVKLCNKAQSPGEGTGTSTHLGALIRFEWLCSETTQLVTSARRRWSGAQMQQRDIRTLVVYLWKMRWLQGPKRPVCLLGLHATLRDLGVLT